MGLPLFKHACSKIQYATLILHMLCYFVHVSAKREDTDKVCVHVHVEDSPKYSLGAYVVIPFL